MYVLNVDRAALSLRQHRKNRSTGFTLTEVLVTTALILMLMAMLLPMLGKSRETARFTAWQMLSKSMQSDPRLALYYNFEGQTGDEVNAAGELIVKNKSNGDAMGLVASEQSSTGAQDPELRYGVLKDSHPADESKGQLPSFQNQEGRFRAKTAMQFFGESASPSQSSNQGSYIRPDYWAGVVKDGQFQIAMWLKLKPFAIFQKPISWGKHLNSSNMKELFSISAPKNEALTLMRIASDGTSSTFFEGRQIHVFDDEWHFVVIRLAQPFSEAGKYVDNKIPEFMDLNVSIDGSPFYSIDANGQDRFNTEITELLIGAKATYDDKASGARSNYIQGLIDEVIIWQEPTSDKEVKQMYRTGAPMGHAPAQWQ